MPSGGMFNEAKVSSGSRRRERQTKTISLACSGVSDCKVVVWRQARVSMCKMSQIGGKGESRNRVQKKKHPPPPTRPTLSLMYDFMSRPSGRVGEILNHRGSPDWSTTRTVAFSGDVAVAAGAPPASAWAAVQSQLRIQLSAHSLIPP